MRVFAWGGGDLDGDCMEEIRSNSPEKRFQEGKRPLLHHVSLGHLAPDRHSISAQKTRLSQVEAVIMSMMNDCVDQGQTKKKLDRL